MIHYHGTPITPKSELLKMKGRNFCVSYAARGNIKDCMRIGQSVMLDNGAFSAFTRGFDLDINGFYEWIGPYLCHPHWAVVPDVIGGSVEDQRKMIKTWPFNKSLGFPVWHLGAPIEYLLELCDQWGHVCLGSSAQYWQVGSDSWARRMDEAFNAMSKTFGRLPWTHGLRMLAQSKERWPLASADSANVARNHHSNRRCAECMANRIDGSNPIKLIWNHKKIRTKGRLC